MLFHAFLLMSEKMVRNQSYIHLTDIRLRYSRNIDYARQIDYNINEIITKKPNFKNKGG